MKKRILFTLLICLCFCAFAKNQNMWIAVTEASLKKSASTFSATTAKVYYGTQVVQTKTKGAWSYVIHGDEEGWISTSSLSKRKIVGEGSNFSADADELALAGKGFSAELEKEYKKSGKADYDAVNEIEKIFVSDDELFDFIVDGKLQGAEQ